MNNRFRKVINSPIRLNNRTRKFNLAFLFLAIAAVLIYFINDFFGVEYSIGLDKRESKFIDMFFIATFILSALYLIYSNRYLWFDSHSKKLKLALAKIINDDFNTQPPEVWIANADDLVNQTLQQGSPLKKLFDDLITKDLKEFSNIHALHELLITIHSHIHLQPQRNQSYIVDELAIWNSKGNTIQEQVESFQIKRSLYQTFSSSWPLRITFFLLIIALGLVGFRTIELAELGQDARKYSQKAINDIGLAQKQLKESKSKLEAYEINLQSLVDDTNKHMDLAKSSVLKAQNNLANTTKKGVDEITIATNDGVNNLKQKLNDRSNALQTDIINLKKQHIKTLNQLANESDRELISLTEEYTSSIGSSGKRKIKALNSNFKKLNAEVSSLIPNYKKTLDNTLLGQQTELAIHLNLKTTELNNKSTEIVGHLLENEVKAIERINKVFDRVESSESQRVEIYNENLTQNEKRIITLEEKIQELNDKINKKDEFAKILINVTEQMANKSDWPEMIVKLIEWRMIVLLFASFLAISSIILSVWVVMKKR